MSCEMEGFLTSGAVSTYEHGNYTAYNNFLFITIDFETLKAVKKKYMEIL
jgi:hypothetical protein